MHGAKKLCSTILIAQCSSKLRYIYFISNGVIVGVGYIDYRGIDLDSYMYGPLINKIEYKTAR